MVKLCNIETRPGLVFDVSVAGDAAAPLVLLHGFAVSRHLYDAQVPALAEAGVFAVALDQRGYSSGARPDPADRATLRHRVADRGLACEPARGLGADRRRKSMRPNETGGFPKAAAPHSGETVNLARDYGTCVAGFRMLGR